ncbi:TetR/AcrR family transcriptional regulator [Almyronema epifaneia]|uniref:TetR/AcrR family transcriptional regulator n=1 Tax=Almyronema epifaneia S1 TaxID=2991925 RepID=A0ABW6IA92_9CYAN
MANLKRTREDILESVIDTIHRKGLTATGLSELFSLSGASSGSFYNYFASKQALGHALIDFEWRKLQKNILEPAAAQGTSAIDQLFWILATLEQKQYQEPFCGGCLLGNLIVDLVEQDASFREHLQAVFSQWESALAQILWQAQTQLKADVNPNLLAEQIMTVLEGAMLMGKLHRSPARLNRSFDIARQLLTSALQEPTYPASNPNPQHRAAVSQTAPVTQP